MQSKKKINLNSSDIDSLFYDSCTNLPTRVALEYHEKNNEFKSVIYVKLQELKKIQIFIDDATYKEVIFEYIKVFKSICQSYGLELYHIGKDTFAITFEKELQRIGEIALEIFVAANNTKKESTNGLLSQVYCIIGYSTVQSKLSEGAYYALKKGLERKEAITEFKEETTLNRIEFYEQVTVSKLIAESLKSKNVVPFFQPIYDKDGKIRKYETLMRIKRGNDIITPGVFLPIAKKINKYKDLEKELIDQAFKLVAERKINVSVNLSVSDVVSSEMRNFILEEIQKYDIGKYIIFEIVEDEDITQADAMLDFVKKAKAYGIRIAIDDFGSGFSNFTHILKMNPDYLKIDGSIIKDIVSDERSQAMLKAIVNFASELKLKTIAEFIHNKETYDYCRNNGVDEFQGFFLSEPKTMQNHDEYEKMIENQKKVEDLTKAITNLSAVC